MDTKLQQHLLRTSSVLLVLAMFLSGQAPPVTALRNYQEPPLGQTTQGYGDFPRLPIVAPSVDGKAPALYLVEGDTATQLVQFDGLGVGSDSAIVRLSPDGKHIAALLLGGDGASTLEVVDVATGGRLTLDRGAGDLAPAKGAAHEDITDLAWLDEEHLVYSKVTSPSSEEWEADASRERGEVWLTDLAGATRRLAEAPVYRLRGASLDGKQAYFSCEPQQEGYLGDGFCALDVATGELRVLWPRDDLPMQGSSASNTAFFGYRVVSMPDGTQRVAFVGTDARGTARSEPPDVWLGDPESGEARIVWTASQGETFDGWSVYDVPVDFVWSPRSEGEFVYLGDGAAFGGVWRVDVASRQANSLKTGNVGLVVWAEEGLVVQSEEAVWLLGEGGEVQGEIRFREETSLTPSYVPNTVVNWDVPYVHQKWDTPSWWDSAGWWGGNWACGPTSAVMALAYYQRLSPHSITLSKPAGMGNHTSEYGWYVPTDSCPYPYTSCTGYTHISACEGTNTFSHASIYTDTQKAAGAYGACVNDYGYADRTMIQTYARRHDVGSYYESAPSEDKVRAELRGGAVVLLDSRLTATTDKPDLGHIVVVRGYTSDYPTRYIVNDPFGDKSSATYDLCNADVDCGDEVLYTWSDLRASWLGWARPKWYVALYSPQYLPDLSKTGDWDGTIAVHNGAQSAGWNANVKVCFMNTSGSLNRTQDSPSIAPNAGWNLSLSSVFGGSAFNGSVVVMPKQTAVSVVVEQLDSSTGSDYGYDGVAAGSAVNSDWGQASTTTRLPLLMDNNSGWSTRVTLLNTGSGTATYDLDYYAENGGGPYQGPQGSLAPYASVTFNQYGTACPTIGAGRVTSNQPLAVIVREYTGNIYSAYNGFSGGATTLNPPLIMANNSGWRTGIAVQNLGSAATDITVNYYPSPGFPSRNPETAYNVQPNATAIFIQGGGQWGSSAWIGSARVTASQPIAAIVNETATGKASTYDCSAGGSGRISLPLVRNDAYGWISGAQVQNLDGATANVILRVGGNQTWSGAIGAYTSLTFLPVPGTSPGFEGPVTVECTNGRQIAAIVNTMLSGGAGDRIRTYNGINR